MKFQNVIKEAAAAVVTTRDFCGNERGAARHVFEDAGVRPTKQMVNKAIRMANRGGHQQESGISMHDQARIHSALEDEIN